MAMVSLFLQLPSSFCVCFCSMSVTMMSRLMLNLHERTEYGVLSALNLSGVQEEIEFIVAVRDDRRTSDDLNDPEASSILPLPLSRAGSCRGRLLEKYPHDGARMNREESINLSLYYCVVYTQPKWTIFPCCRFLDFASSRMCVGPSHWCKAESLHQPISTRPNEHKNKYIPRLPLARHMKQCCIS
jgi:hypothetical protein